MAYAIGRQAGGAVQRNRIRRRLRHVVSEHAGELRPDHQYLVGAGAGVGALSPTALTASWLGVLTRAHEVGA